MKWDNGDSGGSRHMTSLQPLVFFYGKRISTGTSKLHPPHTAASNLPYTVHLSSFDQVPTSDIALPHPTSLTKWHFFVVSLAGPPASLYGSNHEHIDHTDSSFSGVAPSRYPNADMHENSRQSRSIASFSGFTAPAAPLSIGDSLIASMSGSFGGKRMIEHDSSVEQMFSLEDSMSESDSRSKTGRLEYFPPRRSSRSTHSYERSVDDVGQFETTGERDESLSESYSKRSQSHHNGGAAPFSGLQSPSFSRSHASAAFSDVTIPLSEPHQSDLDILSVAMSASTMQLSEFSEISETSRSQISDSSVSFVSE